MRDDEQVAAGLQLGREALGPVGQHAGERVLERLRRGQLLRVEVR